MMKSHRQPASPCTWFKFLYAAAWRYPENIDPSELPMNQTPARLKSSSLRYHDPRMKCTPANDGASKKPMSARMMYKSRGVCTRDSQNVRPAHTSSSTGSSHGAMRGLVMSAMSGIWPTT